MIENERRVAAGAQEVLLRRDLAEVLVAQRADEGKMAMPFDEAGHQCETPGVYRLRRRLGADLTLSSGDLGNSIPDDKNLAGVAVIRFAVPNLHVSEKIGRHRDPPANEAGCRQPPPVRFLSSIT